MAEHWRAVRAVLRREERGYLVEVAGPSGQTRTRHATLIDALNAHPTLRQLWRPARPEEIAESGLGPGLLYVVPR